MRNHCLDLCYYQCNKELHPERLVYYFLVRFYQFVKEEDLFSLNWTNPGKMLYLVVCATVIEKKQIFASNKKLIESSLAETLTQDQEKQFYNDQQEKSPKFNKQENNEYKSTSIGEIFERNRQREISYFRAT